MHPFNVSLSRSLLLNLCATPSPSTSRDMEGLLLPPSLPHHSWNGAAPLSWCCSLAAISPFCQFTETVSSKSHLRLKTKQQRLDFFLFPCQKPYIPCQDVTCNTLHYRHTSLMLTQSRGTLTALSHIISGLMHQGKASALW